MPHLKREDGTLSCVVLNVDSSLIKPLPLTGKYNRDPNNKAFKRRGFINHGFTFTVMWSNRLWVLLDPQQKECNMLGACKKKTSSRPKDFDSGCRPCYSCSDDFRRDTVDGGHLAPVGTPNIRALLYVCREMQDFLHPQHR